MSENTKERNIESNNLTLDKSAESRRRLLKKSAAIPVIMTLHSGAALARTSNTVSAITDLNAAAKGGNSGDILCVHPGSNGGQLEDGRFDLGNAPTVSVNYQNQNNLEKQAEECLTNRGGIIISATAYASLSGRGVLPNSGTL